MAKQDEWSRITLRLPKELHEQLVDSAGAKSLNAEIVERLAASYSRKWAEYDHETLKTLKNDLDRNEKVKVLVHQILEAAYQLDLEI